MKEAFNKNIYFGIFTHNFPENEKDRKNAGIFVYDLVNQLKKTVSPFVFFPSKDKFKKKVGSILCHCFSYPSKKNLGNLKIYNPIDLFGLIMFFLKGLLSLKSFSKKFPKNNFNIVMWAFPSGVFTLVLKKVKKVPYAVWSLGSDIYIYAKLPLVSKLIKKILIEADFVVADGIDLCKEVEKITNKKCIFIPSSSKVGMNFRSMVKLDKDRLVITFLGRMEEVKGPDILVEALLKLGNKIKEYKVNFVGDGSLLNQLKSDVRKKSLSKNIKFYGNISDENQIEKILKSSHWLVIPSRSESIPLVFSEAMRSGLPIISSDLPDLKYLIDKYKVGITFKAKKSEKLADLLKKVDLLKQKREYFSRNTSKVAKIFNIDYSSKQLLKLIRKNVK